MRSEAARRVVGSLACAGLLGLSGCSGLTKLDYGHLFSRDGWQRPDDVVRVLAIEPGTRVADLGAGEGYFIARLAAAVGPEGRVYAVEVEDEALAALERFVAEQGLANVDVVRGTYADPGLPDGAVDLVLLVNTYHHIEDRESYFAGLRGDLAPAGRVAVIDPNEELTGIVSWFLDEGHTSRAADVRAEMSAAGYVEVASHEFLLTQIFEIFRPAARSADHGVTQPGRL